jgi:hypothetical protein
MSVAALVAVAAIGVIILFQAGLAMGAPWGSAAWGGTHAGTLPSRFRLASTFSIVILMGLAWVVAVRDGAIASSFSADVIQTLAWIVAGYFILGTIMNAISRSKLERWWSPVSAVIAACVVVVAAS